MTFDENEIKAPTSFLVITNFETLSYLDKFHYVLSNHPYKHIDKYPWHWYTVQYRYMVGHNVILMLLHRNKMNIFNHDCFQKETEGQASFIQQILYPWESHEWVCCGHAKERTFGIRSSMTCNVAKFYKAKWNMPLRITVKNALFCLLCSYCTCTC